MQAERGEVHGAKVEVEDVLVRHTTSADRGSVWQEKKKRKSEKSTWQPRDCRVAHAEPTRQPLHYLEILGPWLARRAGRGRGSCGCWTRNRTCVVAGC